MTHSDRFYQLLAQDGVDEAIALYDQQVGKWEQDLLRAPSVALGLALHGRVREAIQVLDADRLAASPEDRSIMLEAEMVIAIRQKRPASEIESLAKRAIEASEEAVFAQRVLGQRAEVARRIQDSLWHYEAAYRAAPQSQRSMRDYARVLVLRGQALEALGIIKKMRLSVRREVYRAWALWRRPARVAMASIVLLITLSSATFPLVLWCVLVSAVILVLLGVRWADVLVFGAGTRLASMALAGWLLAEILRRTAAG